MSESLKWVVGVAMGFFALLGLVMASKAQDEVFYFVGLLFFAFGVVFNYALAATSGRPRSAGSPGD